MGKYTCKCPAPGCSFGLTIEADDWESAFKEMFTKGSHHIIEEHPDFPQADFPEDEARKYALKNMRSI